ncbi:tripeptide aminopeptidase PepT [bacterium]|nr:tripeptide aminopeptidase PepT [bacterium]
MQFTGKGVKPIVHRAWTGSPIILPHNGLILDPREMPALQRVENLNDTIITSSGDTLLGADDKSGVAALFAVARRLLELPAEERGATVEFVFNTDEEIGLRSASKLEYLLPNVVAGYTFDGETFGQVDVETWHAEGCELKVQGVSVHPGYATGKMVNAAALLSQFVAVVHARAEADESVGTPRTTKDRNGFLHFTHLHGDVSVGLASFILRDFDAAGVALRRAVVEGALHEVEAAAPPEAEFNLTCSTTYKNMKSYLDEKPLVVARAVEAVKRATGVDVVNLGAIRGGTDGSVLTLRGKPTPNIFAGWHEAHGPKEWASMKEMVWAAETALHLLALWADGENSRAKPEL